MVGLRSLSGRANKPSGVALGGAALAAVALALPPLSGANGTPSISALRAANAHLAAKARSAVLSLYSLDAELSSARTRLAGLEARAARLQTQRAQTKTELRIARRETKVSIGLAASRLRYLYDYGTSPSSLEIVLGANSLNQALTRIDDANAVADADRSIILRLRSAQARLSTLSLELTADAERLEQTTEAQQQTVTTLAGAAAERSSYISELQSQHSYNTQEIGQLTAEAQAAEERAEELQRTASVASTASVAPSPWMPVGSPTSAIAPSQDVPAGAQQMTVIATGYDLQGLTATGIPVGYGVAAVDPSVIALGSHMTVPGYGEAVAADTGGAIIGNRIDLWFPTAAQAFAWGIRVVTIVVYS